METEAHTGRDDEQVAVATELDRGIWVVGLHVVPAEQVGNDVGADQDRGSGEVADAADDAVSDAVSDELGPGTPGDEVLDAFTAAEAERIAREVERWVGAHALVVRHLEDGGASDAVEEVLVSPRPVGVGGAGAARWRVGADGALGTVHGLVRTSGAEVERVRRTVQHTPVADGGGSEAGDSQDAAYAAAYLLQLLGTTTGGQRVAVVGDVGLDGEVLGVDRVDDRLAAAQRAGCAHLVVPSRSQVLPGDHEGVQVWWVASLDEVMTTVLEVCAGASTGEPASAPVYEPVARAAARQRPGGAPPAAWALLALVMLGTALVQPETTHVLLAVTVLLVTARAAVWSSQPVRRRRARAVEREAAPEVEPEVGLDEVPWVDRDGRTRTEDG
jgi:hypothetical protein